MGALPSGFTSTKHEADENVSPARNVSAVLVHGHMVRKMRQTRKEMKQEMEQRPQREIPAAV